MDRDFGDLMNHDLAGYHATGIRLRDVPIHLEKLRRTG
jgi:hypothetical protein